MVVKSRREEYAEITRTAIIDAAAARFALDGYAGASIDAIAESARVTKGAVYHHFSDKADLFEAVYSAIEDDLLSKVIAGVDGITDPWDALIVGADVFLDRCLDAPFAKIALEEAPVALGWSRWKTLEESHFLGLLSGALEALALSGTIRHPPGDLTSRMLLAALDEAGLAIASSGSPPEERQRAGEIFALLLEGLKAPS